MHAMTFPLAYIQNSFVNNHKQSGAACNVASLVAIYKSLSIAIYKIRVDIKIGTDVADDLTL